MKYCIGKIPILRPDGSQMTDDKGNPAWNEVVCEILHWGRKLVVNPHYEQIVYEDVIYAVNLETLEIVELDPLLTVMADRMVDDE